MFKTICWALALMTLSCCGVSKAVNLAQSGKATPASFNREIPFRYIQDHLFIEVEMDGQLYNFLFDTGFDFTVIAEEHQPAGFTKSFDYLTSGTSFEELRLPYGTIPALRIDGVQFEEIGVGIMDLSFINQDYVCEQQVDGVIGANLMRKAKWQIDYEAKVIRFSDDLANLELGSDPVNVPVKDKGWGSLNLVCELDGQAHEFRFDTGSGGRFTAGLDFDAMDGNDQLVSLRGGDTAYEQRLVRIATLGLGEIQFNNDYLSLERGASALAGNKFLRDFLVTVDWEQSRVILSERKRSSLPPIYYYDLGLSADFDALAIIVSAVKQTNSLSRQVAIGSKVLRINDVDVSNLSFEALCDYWTNQKPTAFSAEELRVQLEGYEEELVLGRKNW